MIPDGCLLDFGDVAAEQPEFPFLDSAIGLLNRDFAFPHALDFASAEHDAAFDLFQRQVFMLGSTIFGNRTFTFVLLGGVFFFFLVF